MFYIIVLIYQSCALPRKLHFKILGHAVQGEGGREREGLVTPGLRSYTDINSYANT